MTKQIDILELFSGIGGFTKGFQQAGYEIRNHYFSEVDKHAIANYRYNFKNATYVGSVTDVRGIIRTVNQDRSGKLVITFGSPCQDFSLAGKGKGLDGAKSSLIKYAIFLIKWLRPDVFIWENVKGAFSTNAGADYWAIIQAFTNLDGYRCEQQLLNTSWFLPQNRERIYVVGHLTGRSEPGVFPIGEKSARLNEGATETRNIRTLTAGGNSGGMHSSMTLIDMNGRSESVDTAISGCLDANYSKGPENYGQRPFIKSGTLRTHKDGQGFRESKGDDCLTLPARAREDGSGQVVIQVVGNLKGEGGHNVNNIHSTNGLAPTVRENHGKVTAIEVKTNTKKGFETAKEGDSINLLNPNSETRRGRVGVGVAQTLDTQCNQAVVKPVLTPDRAEKRQNCRRMKEDGEDAFTLGCQDQHGVMINNSIRRLTEIEFERLQGFDNSWRDNSEPVNWTKYGIYTNKNGINEVKEIPKTQRYKMCGNAVTVDVVQAISEKIKFI